MDTPTNPNWCDGCTPEDCPGCSEGRQEQSEALRLAHALDGGKLIDDSTEWADTLHASAAELRRLHARVQELEQTRERRTGMTKHELLLLLRLLSALESWAFSLQSRLPDYLHEDLVRMVERLQEEILK